MKIEIVAVINGSTDPSTAASAAGIVCRAKVDKNGKPSTIPKVTPKIAGYAPRGGSSGAFINLRAITAAIAPGMIIFS